MEEFPALSASSLKIIVDNHCKNIENNLSCHNETMTTSIGAAMLKYGEDSHSWLARADAALYAAKNAGRNRAIVDNGSGI